MRLYTDKQLQARIDAAVAAAIAPLLARIAELEQQLAAVKKNSSNSSKPPSSDIVKPPKPPGGGSCPKPGAQRGHPRHDRSPFSPEQIDRTVLYERRDLDPRDWEPLDEWDTLHQVELKESPLTITEHRARHYRHRRTGRIRVAELPPAVRAAGLVGPRLSAYVAFLKGACHVSYSTIQTLLRDVFDLSLSTGQLAKLTTVRAAAALATPYEELCASLPNQPRLGIDETGHKDNGQRHWTWCFRAAAFVVFRVDPSRGSAVLERMLGDAFTGVIHCDYYSAYRKFMTGRSLAIQFCLAHLIRDVKFLAEQNDRVTRNWAQRMLQGLAGLFRLLHRREQLTGAGFQRQLEARRDRLIQQFKSAPDRPGVRDLRRRFKLHAKEFFTFVTTPGVEPTNNLTEQAIRYVIIDRKVTQGTRGPAGQRWSERIWTVLSTCRLQRRSAFAFLEQAVHAFLRAEKAPSLLPRPP